MTDLGHSGLGMMRCRQRPAAAAAIAAAAGTAAVLAGTAAAARGRLEVAQSPADEADLRGPVHESGGREGEVDGGDGGDEHQPEPDDDEDLLVEEVDSERALDDVVVHARLVMNLHTTTFATQ